MARVEQDVGALVSFDLVQESLERRAVVQVLAGMDLEADVDAGMVERVEDRPPASRELLEPGFDEPRRGLRPRIHRVPEQRARERCVRFELEALTRPSRRA